MQKESSTSVVIKYTDPERICEAVESYALRLKSQYDEIKRIFWFGSWIHGLPSPGSDVDICLLLSHSDLPLRERVSLYISVGFPVGIDLFPYTESEFIVVKSQSPVWYQSILSGREL